MDGVKRLLILLAAACGDGGGMPVPDASLDAAPPGPPEMLVEGLADPRMLAVGGDRLYWIEGGADIYSSPIFGADLANLSGGQPMPYELVADASGVTFTLFGGQGVRKWHPVDGTTTVTVRGERTSGIALVGDATWYGSWGDPGATGVIFRVVPGMTAEVITQVTEPRRIAVDATHVYYVAAADGMDRVNRFDVAGGNETVVFETSSEIRDLAAEETRLFLSIADGTIVSFDKATMAATTLASGQDDPQELVVDARHVYWASAGDGTINRVDKNGGNPAVVAGAQMSPFGIATDGTHVYWTDPGAGTVMRAQK